MTSDQFTHALETLGWSERELARRLACDPKLANRWSRGISEVPTDLGRWLDQLVKASARVTPPSWRQK